MTAAETEWADLYRANVDAVTALARDLDDSQLATVVPASPAWSVRDVLAHLAGGPADVVSGRMEGAPSPEWTARHVGERRDLAVDDLTAEMRAHEDAIAAWTVDNPRPAIVWDIAVHHADLHEALGLGVLPERLWTPVLGAAVAMKLSATGMPEQLEPYELFRALFSRRSRTQMQAWGLPLSAEQLDDLCIFGPRDDDQPVP